jgi:hypothetical protein
MSSRLRPFKGTPHYEMIILLTNLLPCIYIHMPKVIPTMPANERLQGNLRGMLPRYLCVHTLPDPLTADGHIIRPLTPHYLLTLSP